MRKLSELLELVNNNLGSLLTGLCSLCSKMYFDKKMISKDEYIVLRNFFNSEFPKKKAQYTLPNHPFPFYHFPVGDVISRKIWLETKIEELQKQDL